MIMMPLVLSLEVLEYFVTFLSAECCYLGNEDEQEASAQYLEKHTVGCITCLACHFTLEKKS